MRALGAARDAGCDPIVVVGPPDEAHADLTWVREDPPFTGPAAAIIAALPFVLVMVALAVALVKDLSSDPLVVRRQYAIDAMEAAVVTGVTEHGDDFVLAVKKDPEA